MAKQPVFYLYINSVQVNVYNIPSTLLCVMIWPWHYLLPKQELICCWLISILHTGLSKLISLSINMLWSQHGDITNYLNVFICCWLTYILHMYITSHLISISIIMVLKSTGITNCLNNAISTVLMPDNSQDTFYTKIVKCLLSNVCIDLPSLPSTLCHTVMWLIQLPCKQHVWHNC